MNDKPKTWKRKKSNEIADCRVFKVREDFSAQSGENTEHNFFVIENPDWVNIIALTRNQEVVLIEQFRHGTEEIVLEIPGGIVDEGEEPIIAAERELIEETGFAAREIVPLGKSRPNPALQNNWIYHFLALDCDRKQDTSFDLHESIVSKLVKLDDVNDLIENEKITHSLVLAAFCKLHTKKLSETISEKPNI